MGKEAKESKGCVGVSQEGGEGKQGAMEGGKPEAVEEG